jgi:hypothetical protein
VAAVAAAKFHSAAVTADGRLLTWGWGRGGRLGEAVEVPAGVLQGSHAGPIQGVGAVASHRSSSGGWWSHRTTATTPAGHPDAQIHSGEGAVITPLLVAGLGRRQVAAVAARVQHLEQELASAKDEAAAQRARAARAEQAAERAARTVMQRKHEHGQVTAALEAQLRQVQEQAKRDALEAEQQYSSRVRGLGAEHSAAVLVQRAAS